MAKDPILNLTLCVLLLAAGVSVSACTDTGGGGGSGATFSGSNAGASTAEIFAGYTQANTSKPAKGVVTVSGLRKIKIVDFCAIVKKVVDNTPVVIPPFKWKNTRAFMIANQEKFNYVCSQFSSLGDMWDKLGVNPRSVKESDLKASLSVVNDVMNNGEVSAGPKTPVTSIAGGCENQAEGKSPGKGKTGGTAAALLGMGSCSPALTIGILEMNNNSNALKNNMTASAMLCMALYGDLYKKAVSAAGGSLASAGKQTCENSGNDAGNGDNGGDGSGDSGGDGGGDGSGG